MKKELKSDLKEIAAYQTAIRYKGKIIFNSL